jgi:hypothetical protein
MFRFTLGAAAFVLVLMTLPQAGAADDDLAKIRDEINQMKQTYERRIEALEKRLADAEARAGKAEQSTAATQGAAPPPAGSTAENAFNPAVSLILQGTYANTSQDPKQHQITGFMPSGGEVGPPRRSFGLGETELLVSGNIDPYFRGVVIAALTPENEVEVEEAYFQTLALPQGLTLKGGRFYSGLGYLNAQHQHTWDFQDAPLPYKAFLGGQLKQDGVQLKWVAPTDLFLEVGAEMSSGDQFPGSDRNKNGIGGAAIFGHIGGDIGASYAWRTGLSYLKMSPRDRTYEDVDSLGGATTNSFTGDARLWVLDGVLKWAPNGNARQRNFKLQGEYFRMKQDGALTYDDTAQAVPKFGTALSDSFNSKQSGYYVQGIWQFMPRWRAGYRYDALRYGTVSNGIVDNALGPAAADFSLLTPHNPSRNSAMLDFSPTEFSRFRVQLAADKSRAGVTDSQVFLQYIHSLGAHGAHQF